MGLLKTTVNFSHLPIVLTKLDPSPTTRLNNRARTCKVTQTCSQTLLVCLTCRLYYLVYTTGIFRKWLASRQEAYELVENWISSWK